MSDLVEEKTWAEFRKHGLLWWVNRVLHIFGWAIVVIVDDETDEIERIFPARTKFRGFCPEAEEENHIKLTKYMSTYHNKLLHEVLHDSSNDSQND